MDVARNLLAQLLRYLCSALLVAMILVLGANVVMRYVFGSPLAWSGELSGLLLVWFSLLGLAVAAAERRHMAMDLLSNALPGLGRRALETLISLISIGVCGYLIYYGIQICQFNLSLNSEQLQISYAFFYAAIPVGFAFYLVFELLHLAGQRDAPSRSANH